MNDETYFGSQVRRRLDEGCHEMEASALLRLKKAREGALSRQAVTTGGLALANGNLTADALLPYLRNIVTIIALLIGMVGTYYWNSFQDADENADVDSALLADELPVAAYTDQGFKAWLNHSSQE